MSELRAKEILSYMIELLKEYLEELNAAVAETEEERGFFCGEKTAYAECLEIIQRWKGAAEHGLNFEIEKRYPLTDL